MGSNPNYPSLIIVNLLRRSSEVLRAFWGAWARCKGFSCSCVWLFVLFFVSFIISSFIKKLFFEAHLTRDTGKGPHYEWKLGLTMKCLSYFVKKMINFKPRQRNNRAEGVGVISNFSFIVCFGSRTKKLKGRPCNKITFSNLFIFFFYW